MLAPLVCVLFLEHLPSLTLHEGASNSLSFPPQLEGEEKIKCLLSSVLHFYRFQASSSIGKTGCWGDYGRTALATLQQALEGWSGSFLADLAALTSYWPWLWASAESPRQQAKSQNHIILNIICMIEGGWAEKGDKESCSLPLFSELNHLSLAPQTLAKLYLNSNFES